ncbi:methyltransferase [Aestuariivirga sp.]|uniref:methyltransferase n=1 Tax=Aestuariivirga sp. TaxID=2650926 RepID=UPI0025BF22B2|nr:methyltransferase [Aestuariivirga sp.]MCA3555762.1 methyltransferase [Aestuariivirga sp.]
MDFPPFRPVSRARSRQLFDLLAGFTYSQVLYCTVKLGLIEMLQGQPLSTAAIAARIGWPAERAERLLKASISLDILERTSTGEVTLGIHGAALAGNPWIARFITHHSLLYADLTDPLGVLSGSKKQNQLKDFWSYADQRNAAGYTALMAASQQAVAAEILASYNFGRHTHLIDIGGSNGTFLKAAAARYPQLNLSLFDLPRVAELARANLGNRFNIHGGSFLDDELPKGPDCASLIRIAHDHDDAAVATLLAAVARMLPPRGTLILAEPLSGLAATAPVADAYFGLYFAAMGQGKTRTPDEFGRMAKDAGFATCELMATRNPVVTGLLRMTMP